LATLSFAGGYFALSVADAEASATWYSEKLGLQVSMRPPKTNKTVVVVLRKGGLTVELLQSDDGPQLSQVAPSVHDRLLVHGIVKAGAVVNDFDAAVAALNASGVPIDFGPFPATAEQPANLVVRDNEGNLIQLLGK
jgi:catechol 2,3-dioxygenase-like lactoylglutathione lyase family enzyme